MSPAAERILQAVLALPEHERAVIAVRLIESLDEGVEHDVDAAWAAEVARRCSELDAGVAVTSDWDEVRRRIEDRLGSK